MKNHQVAEHYDTIVIGGGQAGLATGYYLKQKNRDFTILDGSERIGDSWRNRWDSLRPFTSGRYNSLPGYPFPGPPHDMPTKDEVADYLEAYARHFELPLQHGVWVDRLTQQDQRFIVEAGHRRFEADNVVVAMAPYQKPRLPQFADQLNPNITQMHSADYRNPSQLQAGGVLIVGAGNSGAEIALDVIGDHSTWLSGRHVGHVPFRIDNWFGRHFGVPFVMRFMLRHLMTINTPIGRKKRPQLMRQGWMLVRVKPADLQAAGVRRVQRMTGVQDGLPVVGDEQVLDVKNVIWCTGYTPNFSWIDLPIFGDQPTAKEPHHQRGVVTAVPGLFFVGLFFQYAAVSSLLDGVARDAEYIVDKIGERPTIGLVAQQVPNPL